MSNKILKDNFWRETFLVLSSQITAAFKKKEKK